MDAVQFNSTEWGPCILREQGKYPDGSMGLVVWGSDDDPSPICVLTVSLNTGPLPDDMYIIKTWGGNWSIARDVLATGVFEDTGVRLPSGRVEAQLWKWKGGRNGPSRATA
jgi:hypothetical protein